MLIQPFLDENHNGKWEPGEKIYTDNSEILFSINNQFLRSLQPEITSDRIVVRLNPGRYRLDLDPAGFPENWQAVFDAYAVDVVAGSYTPVLLPLTRSYTLSGVVTDTQGNPIGGARVEAISTTNPRSRLFSVTNTAGVYYLERLQHGNYTLLINDKPVDGMTLKLDNSSQAVAELNIQESENQKYQAINRNLNQSALPNANF